MKSSNQPNHRKSPEASSGIRSESLRSSVDRGGFFLVVFLVWIGAFSWVPTPAAAEETLILSFGDSITWGFGDGSTTCFTAPAGYPPRLGSQLRAQDLDVVVRHSAVCGEVTSGGVSRIDDVLRDNPDAGIIVVMEGTNDLSSASISVASMRFNINSILSKIEAAGVSPVLGAPPPRAPEAGPTDRTAFFSVLLREDAGEREIPFAETYDTMNRLPGLFTNFYSDPLHPNSAGYPILASIFVDPIKEALDRRKPEPCVPGDETLCLSQGRFTVEVEWETAEDSGRGQAVPRSQDTGLFWFFNEQNLEVVVKVLDGRENNGHFWVFYGGLSDVAYTLTVTDSETGRRRIYTNPQGTQASAGDTFAFEASSP